MADKITNMDQLNDYVAGVVRDVMDVKLDEM